MGQSAIERGTANGSLLGATVLLFACLCGLCSCGKPKEEPTLADLVLTRDADAVSDFLKDVPTKADRKKLVNASVPGSQTKLLHIAALTGQSRVINVLLNAGAEIEAPNEDGWTPLMYAAYFNNLDALQVLVGRGANLEARSKEGSTSLTLAAARGSAEAVHLLLYYGASTETKDNLGRTPAEATRIRISEVTLHDLRRTMKKALDDIESAERRTR